MFSSIKKIIFMTIFFQGLAMSAVLFSVEVKGAKVPVIFEQDKRLPLASMEIVFQNSGSLADTKAGIASLSAKLLGEGTKKEGAVKFAESLEDRAVSLSANSGRETFVLSLNSLKSEFDFGIKKLDELLSEPNFTQSAFEKVQTQRLGVLERKKSDFDYVAAMGLRSILFENTPLQHPDLGTIKSIKSMTLDDLKNYIQSHLFIDNVIVVLGGNFSEDEAKDIVKRALSPLKRGKVKEIERFSASSAQRKKVDYEDTDQAYIYFGAPYDMEANSTKRVFGKVASFILGSSGFGSRLMEEIRVKRGLAYSAYSRFPVSRTYSYFSGYLQTKLSTEDEAVKIVKEVVDKFIKDGATQEELDSARKFFLGSEPLRTETLVQRMDRAFHEYYDGLGLDWSKKELDMIKNMKLKDLNEFIESHKEIGELSWSIVTNKKR